MHSAAAAWVARARVALSRLECARPPENIVRIHSACAVYYFTQLLIFREPRVQFPRIPRDMATADPGLPRETFPGDVLQK